MLNITEKQLCWKSVDRKSGFVCLCFDPTQLNSLSTIDTIRWLGGQVVTPQTAVQEVLGSIPGFDKDFYVCFFVLLLLWVFFGVFVQKALFT